MWIRTKFVYDNAITSAKLASDAVVSAAIADDAVDTEHIADDALSADADGRALIEDDFFNAATATAKFEDASIDAPLLELPEGIIAIGDAAGKGENLDVGGTAAGIPIGDGAGVIAVAAIAGDVNVASDGTSTLDLDNLSAAAVDPALDSIGIVSAAAAGASKKESIDDLVTAVAGDGIQNTASQFAVDVSDFAGTGIEDDGSENLRLAAQGNGIAGGAGSILSVAPDSTTGGTVIPVDVSANGVGVDVADIAPAVAAAAVSIANDSVLIVDADDSNATKAESWADIATAMAGDGIAATAGVLAVDVSDFAGAGLADDGSENLTINMHGLGAIPALDMAADSLALIDATDNGSYKQTLANLVNAMAGNGIAATAGVLELALNEVTAGAIDQAADSIVFIDADDSNAVKKESVADLASAMADGSSVTAAGGVLSAVVTMSGYAEAAFAPANDYVSFLDGGVAGTNAKDQWADIAALVAGDGLQAAAGVLAIDASDFAGAGLKDDGSENLALDIESLTNAAIAAGDSLVFGDTDDGGLPKKRLVSELVTMLAAGTGIKTSGTGLAVDLNELSDTAFAPSQDRIPFVDNSDSGTKRDNWRDIAVLIAGAGLRSNGTDGLIKSSCSVVSDPGTGAAIPVTVNTSMSFTIGTGAETNTLAIPEWAGQRMSLMASTVGGGGTRAVTAASALNSAGNTVMTFDAVDDFACLEGVDRGGTLCWRILTNENVALS
jgi:hypothetical protein